MFCGKCGADNPENVKFCSKCGAPLENQAVSATASDTAAAAKKPLVNNKYIGIAAVAVVVVLLFSLIFGGRGYKSTVKKYVNATYSGKGKVVVSLMPKKFVKLTLEKSGYKKSKLIKELDKELKSQIDRLGDNWSFSYKIVKVKDVKKDDLKELKEDYKEDYNIKISAAKEVKLELTISFKGSDQKYTNTLSVPVVKIGSSWYLDVENGSF